MGWASRTARKADLADGAERRRAWDAAHPEFSVPASRERLLRLEREFRALPEAHQAEPEVALERASRVFRSHVDGYAPFDRVRVALDEAEAAIAEARVASGTATPDVRLAKGRP